MNKGPRLHEVTSQVGERHPQDGWELADPIALSKASQRALRGLIAAILPPAPAPRPDGMEARVALHVRRMIAYMPPALRLGLVLITHVLDWSPLWRLKALKPIHALPPDRASAILSDIASSYWMPLRLMMLAPKALILSTYYDQDEVHALLDYEPKAFIRERVSHREQLLRSAQATEDAVHAGAAQ